METGRGNGNNIGVTNEILERDKTEYYSHSRAKFVDG